MDCCSFSYTANGFGTDEELLAKFDTFDIYATLRRINGRYIVSADDYDRIDVYEEFSTEAPARELYTYLTTTDHIDGRKLRAVIRRLHAA